MANDYSVHYCSYNSIVVCNPAGRLKQLYTPFRVSSREPKGMKPKWFVVEEVISGNDDSLYFQINGKVYFHNEFMIDIQF